MDRETKHKVLEDVVSLEQYAINIAVQFILVRKALERLRRDDPDI